MTDDLVCMVRGCRGIACFGHGSLRKGTLRRACAAHRHLLRQPDPPPRGRGAQGDEGQGAARQERLL